MDFERLFEQHVKPFEERYEAAKAVSTKLWQEHSAISSQLDFLPLDSDEYKTLNAECAAKKAEYDTDHERGKRWAEEFLNTCGISRTYYEKHRTDICSHTATDENKRFRKSIDRAIENARRLTLLP